MRAALPITFTLLWLAGCGGGEPLDSETALGLIRDRNTDPVQTRFSAVPQMDRQDNRMAQAYLHLMEAHVIECHTSSLGTICEPGVSGQGITLSGANELMLNAGHWVPVTVLSISRTGRNRATAEVRLTFEASQLYAEFESDFDSVQTVEAAQALGNKKQGWNAHAVFQHYDDGWHLESIQ
jgi:hypothetical protein